MKYGNVPDAEAREKITAELNAYVEACYKHEEELQLKDVYVTDHKKVEPKRTTGGSEEDEDFFQYQQAVDDYNNNIPTQVIQGQEKSLYERGTMIQRMLDPFYGAGTDENGTILFQVTDKDLAHLDLENEAKLRREFENIKENNNVWEVDEENLKVEILKNLEEQNTGFDVEHFRQVVHDELSVFANKKYNFAEDLKKGYHRSLRTTTEQKIFDSIPDWVFWDIKTPMVKRPFIRRNKYNPFRGREYENFFDMRATEQHFHSQETADNRNPSVSIYRRY